MLDVIHRLGYDSDIRFLKEAELYTNLKKVNTFLFDPPMGQIRRDCIHRKHTMVGFSLGKEGDSFSEDDKKRFNAKVINDIYIGEEKKNRTYTILGLMYIEVLKEVLHGRFETAWLCTGSSLTRQEIYEGPLDKLLDVLKEGWGIPYEWTLTSSSLHWAVDYNHHKSMVILGDVEADHAYNQLGRGRWKEYCLHRNLYPRQH